MRTEIASPAYNSVAHGAARPGRFNSIGRAPATFGELIQGREAVTDNDFLVTLPITVNATVKFCGFDSSENLYVFPRTKVKSLLAARLFIRHFKVKPGGILHVHNSLWEGKGLASSSADVVATIRAMASYHQIELHLEDILAIMREIEPSDGVMFNEAVSFFHRKVELKSVIGKLPPMCILALDEGGVVDTVTYNKRSFEFSEEEKARYVTMLGSLTSAIRSGDLSRVGSVATDSARLHQKRHRKRSLDRLEQIMERVGAEGVVNCHSGTFIGLCFDSACNQALDRIAQAQQLLADEFQQPVYRFFSR